MRWLKLILVSGENVNISEQSIIGFYYCIDKECTVINTIGIDYLVINEVEEIEDILFPNYKRSMN